LPFFDLTRKIGIKGSSERTALYCKRATRCSERLNPAARPGESLHKARVIGETAAGFPQGEKGKSRRVGNHLKLFQTK